MQIRRVAGELGYLRIGKREMKEFAERCPACDQKGVPIAYGYPSGEMRQRAEKGEVMLGGCMPQPEQWHCPGCDSAW